MGGPKGPPKVFVETGSRDPPASLMHRCTSETITYDKAICTKPLARQGCAAY
jgi:hypothetical protein